MIRNSQKSLVDCPSRPDVAGKVPNVMNLSGEPSIDQLLGSALGATITNLNEIAKTVRSALAAEQEVGEQEDEHEKLRAKHPASKKLVEAA